MYSIDWNIESRQRNMGDNLTVSTIQMPMFPSSDAVAMRRPSVDHARSDSPSLCPRIVRIKEPVAVSQILSVLSAAVDRATQFDNGPKSASQLEEYDIAERTGTCEEMTIGAELDA